MSRCPRPGRSVFAVVALLTLLAVACDGGTAGPSEGDDRGDADDGRDDLAEALPEAAPDELTGHELPETLRYVALGDSIAAGSGAQTSYVDEFAERLRAETGSEVELSNNAVPGWTAEDLLPAVRGDEELRRELAAAHVITFNIGGNDLLAALRLVIEGRCGGDDDEDCLRGAVSALTDTWDELVTELVEVADGEVDGLRTMDVYPPAGLGGVGPMETTLRSYLAEVNQHLVDSAEAAGIEVARVHDAFEGVEAEGRPEDGLLATDGIHPNDRGHERIADSLLDLGIGIRQPD